MTMPESAAVAKKADSAICVQDNETGPSLSTFPKLQGPKVLKRAASMVPVTCGGGQDDDRGDVENRPLFSQRDVEVIVAETLALTRSSTAKAILEEQKRVLQRILECQAKVCGEDGAKGTVLKKGAVRREVLVKAGNDVEGVSLVEVKRMNRCRRSGRSRYWVVKPRRGGVGGLASSRRGGDAAEVVVQMPSTDCSSDVTSPATSVTVPSTPAEPAVLVESLVERERRMRQKAMADMWRYLFLPPVESNVPKKKVTWSNEPIVYHYFYKCDEPSKIAPKDLAATDTLTADSEQPATTLTSQPLDTSPPTCSPPTTKPSSPSSIPSPPTTSPTQEPTPTSPPPPRKVKISTCTSEEAQTLFERPPGKGRKHPDAPPPPSISRRLGSMIYNTSAYLTPSPIKHVASATLSAASVAVDAIRTAREGVVSGLVGVGVDAAFYVLGRREGEGGGDGGGKGGESMTGGGEGLGSASDSVPDPGSGPAPAEEPTEALIPVLGGVATAVRSSVWRFVFGA
ncbi:hypothetical protein HDU67_005250 [Dinochytrium kinnereticum]|nr:hypothetical protein HDU67_005250 [Dinochytrium kinnereticum]